MTGTSGLSSAEVKARRGRYGPNALPEAHESALAKLLGHLWGPIPWMIEAAALLSGLVRRWVDLGIILALLGMNAGVGFWEELQAGNAVEALRKRLALRARVLRDGHWSTVSARELVPGDVLRLRLGDIVPADVQLLGGTVEVDQSALTGESLPVERGNGQVAYSSSVVRRGEADAQVVAIGAGTYFGKTAKLVEAAHTVSHFQRAVLQIGNFLIGMALVIVAVVIPVSILRGEPWADTLEFALVLTVAAVPVALPAVLSVTMAVGARKLARKEAVVTRLSAVEELAGIDVLCSDKTGTLTQGRLTRGEPAPFRTSADQLLLAARLASRVEDQDPIDLAILGDAKAPDATVLAFEPFDPVRKRTEAELQMPDGARCRVAKGAPQVIQALVNGGADVRSWLDGTVEGFARRGHRSIAVARTGADGQWSLLGVIPLFDPPRADSQATIAQAESLSIAVKMVTGDQAAIAREIATSVGLSGEILEASEIDRSSPERLAAAAGFAQVFPEHKYRIVEQLQKQGHIVGMTGDGVNDAPALKKADVGIAVSGATDTARAAAAIVLLGEGLSVIVDAIGESRRIFERMTSYAIYRIAETIRVLLFMALAILVFGFYPVTAVMIVLLALLNDGAILSIAYDRALPAPRPVSWRMRTVLTLATVLGVLGLIASFLLFFGAERLFHVPRPTVRTLMYLKLSVAGHMTIFAARTRGPFWSVRPSWVLLIAVVTTQLLATLIAVSGLWMAPISWGWAGATWLYAFGWLLVNDGIKRRVYRWNERHPPRRRQPAAMPERTRPVGKMGRRVPAQ